jgi:hypothetical protein
MDKQTHPLKSFFSILGIIAVIAVIIFVAFRLLNPSSDAKIWNITNNNEGTEVDANPLLNESQEDTLELIGVDPSGLPSEITPAMQICFVEKLGAKRAQEIADGDSPTPADYVKAKACLGTE